MATALPTKKITVKRPDGGSISMTLPAPAPQNDQTAPPLMTPLPLRPAGVPIMEATGSNRAADNGAEQMMGQLMPPEQMIPLPLQMASAGPPQGLPLMASGQAPSLPMMPLEQAPRLPLMPDVAMSNRGPEQIPGGAVDDVDVPMEQAAPQQDYYAQLQQMAAAEQQHQQVEQDQNYAMQQQARNLQLGMNDRADRRLDANKVEALQTIDRFSRTFGAFMMSPAEGARVAEARANLIANMNDDELGLAGLYRDQIIPQREVAPRFGTPNISDMAMDPLTAEQINTEADQGLSYQASAYQSAASAGASEALEADRRRQTELRTGEMKPSEQITQEKIDLYRRLLREGREPEALAVLGVTLPGSGSGAGTTSLTYAQQVGLANNLQLEYRQNDLGEQEVDAPKSIDKILNFLVTAGARSETPTDVTRQARAQLLTAVQSHPEIAADPELAAALEVIIRNPNNDTRQLIDLLSAYTQGAGQNAPE